MFHVHSVLNESRLEDTKDKINLSISHLVWYLLSTQYLLRLSQRVLWKKSTNSEANSQNLDFIMLLVIELPQKHMILARLRFATLNPATALIVSMLELSVGKSYPRRWVKDVKWDWEWKTSVYLQAIYSNGSVNACFSVLPIN